MKEDLLKRKEELNAALQAHIRRRNEIEQAAQQELAQHNATIGRLAEVEYLLSLLEPKSDTTPAA